MMTLIRFSICVICVNLWRFSFRPYNPLPSRLLQLIFIGGSWLLVAGAAEAQQPPLQWGADPSGGAPYVFNDPTHPDQYIGYEKEMVDALATAMQNATDAADLRAAASQAHTDLQQLHENLVADDPAPPAP